MKRTIPSILVVIVLSLLVTSCWSRRELNELAIVVALGIDKIDDQYQVSMQIVNPTEISARLGGSGRSPVILLKEKGKTIQEAGRRALVKSPRRYFFAHLQILVLGEKIAKEGFREALDFFWRDHEFRFDYYLMVAKDNTAENILKVLTPLEKLPSQKLLASLESSERYWGSTADITLDELVVRMLGEGNGVGLSGVEIIGERDPMVGGGRKNIEMAEPRTKLKYTKLAIFKEDKMVGWLNEAETIGTKYIVDELKSTLIVVPCPKNKGHITLDVVRSDTKVKGKVENEKPSIHIYIKSSQNLSETQCEALDLSLPETIFFLEKEAEKQLANTIRSAVNAAQKKYKIDFLGFGNAIRRADPKFWKKYKKNWKHEFTKVPVHLHFDLKIYHTGTSSNSYLHKMEKRP
jgi:spore germination protein KC